MQAQASGPLAGFSPATRAWFTRAFDAPTPAQALAWPAIASGEHVLLSAPTGSGKTLAAFLWAIDALSRERGAGGGPGQGSGERERGPAGGGRSSGEPAAAANGATKGVRLVYISPLKALSYDIERNLRVPLRGIGAELRVGVRTGDTPQRERQAMLRKPPDILITTPESLYLMLTGRAQTLFEHVRWCIVDEIHALASSKRGSHLALTLERLTQVAAGGAGQDRGLMPEMSVRPTFLTSTGARTPDQPEPPQARPAAARRQELQRIGLSATQRPLEEVAKFLVGPSRACRIVDAGLRKPLDLRIEVPVESMRTPGDTPGAELDPLAGGGESMNNSIWPAIYPQLLKLVRAHHSTIVFVNARRGAERLALRLNELAAAEDEAAGRPPQEIARAHHGSLAREQRTAVEELLKSGQLPCLVATSSLELGIDMGAVDLVIQVQSPRSVASGLQRIGRAGHNVGDVSHGRIFPKFRADLLECAVVARRMREGEIERTVIPRNALDVLAQQIVAIAAAAPAEEPVSVDRLYALVTRTYTYCELTRAAFENVLDMLDGRYPSSEFAQLRPRIVWDRIAATIRARPGARRLAVLNAGTIPDRGNYLVTLPDGRRVGELDEEMVYEARPGQTFLLGASTWRIEEIGRDRVIVTPAPGVPGTVPFWKGDSVGREAELGAAIGAFSRWAVDQDPQALEAGYDLDPRAARNLVEFLREQRDATGVLPSDLAIVLERFRDEIGDFRLCVLSPFGGRVHAAWGLAIAARMRTQLELEADVIWSDDGIALHLPDVDELDPAALAELVAIQPDEVEDLVVRELAASALFGSRFRENAARALLLPRAYPGRRTPLWQQRLKSQSLLEVARKYGDFPVVLETFRECLKDVLDLPALTALLARISRREVSLVSVQTQNASPFASSLLFDYVAAYMYEGDTPSAERRAAALSLDRQLLRELLGQEELRDLIDPGALERLEADLQWRSPERRVATREQLHDMLRVLGDLSETELGARCVPGVDPTPMLDALLAERRAVAVRLHGERRVIAAAEAGLYRDALGVVPPGGLPDAFLAEVPDALTQIVRRYAASHGPFLAAELRARYGVDTSATLRELERDGELVQAELRPGGVGREWCEVSVLRRLRRASLAALRKEVEPVAAHALARFLPAWQGVDRHQAGGAGVERHQAGGAGVDRLRDVLLALQGVALPAEVWERDVLPRRLGAYSPAWIDQLCASGELVWLGAGALGRASGRVALYFREDLPLLAGRAAEGKSEPEPERTQVQAALLERLAHGAAFFADLLAELAGELSSPELAAALWELAWAGEVTNDAFAPLRAPRIHALASGGLPAGGSAAHPGRPTAKPGEDAGAAAAGPLTGSRPNRFRARARGRRIASARHLGGARRGARGWEAVQGRWSLTAPLFAPVPQDPAVRRRALAELLLERNGILTREQIRAEGVPGGLSALYPELAKLETLGIARRGYFVEGLGGVQFALPGAVERLREQRDDHAPPLVLSAVDPAQPYGAALPWPRPDADRDRGAAGNGGTGAGGAGNGGTGAGGTSAGGTGTGGTSAGGRVGRVPGAFVVLCGGEPILYLERGGRSLQTLVHAGDPRLAQALAALVEHVRAGRAGLRRLALEKVDGQAALRSALGPELLAQGFQEGPRRLTLRA